MFYEACFLGGSMIIHLLNEIKYKYLSCSVSFG